MSGAIFAIVFFGFFIVMMLISVLGTVKRTKNNQQTNNLEKMTFDTPEKKETETVQKKYTGTVNYNNGAEHEHLYSETETFDKIVGSLGEVNDEGCAELDGLRLISKDHSYETEEEKAEIDLNKIAGAIVFGEVLGKPRATNPYRVKR